MIIILDIRFFLHLIVAFDYRILGKYEANYYLAWICDVYSRKPCLSPETNFRTYLIITSEYRIFETNNNLSSHIFVLIIHMIHPTLAFLNSNSYEDLQ